MRIRTTRGMAALAAGALLLAACGDADTSETQDAAEDAVDTSADDEPGEGDTDGNDDHDNGHEDDHDNGHEHNSDEHDDSHDDAHDHDAHDHDANGFEEVADPQPRLVVADAQSPSVSVIDLATEEVLASLDIEAPGAVLWLGSEQRVVAAVQTGADTVQFLDPGTWAVDHGDHAHYYVGAPRLLDARLDTGTPIHTTADFGRFVIFGDDDGAAHLVPEQALLEHGDPDIEVVETGAPHHGGAVQLSPDLVVISGPQPDQDGGLADEVWVLHDGEQVGTYECPGLHGELTGRSWTAFACADRILLLEAHGDHAHSQQLFYPEDLGEDFRLGYLRTSPEHDVFVSTRGDHLVFADAGTGELTIVDLPSETATRSVVDDDGNVLVLTDDGILHLFDLDTSALVASSSDPVTIDQGEDAPRFSIVGGRDRAYVPSPSEGLIHEFATNDDLRLARTIDIGGAPANLAFVGAWSR